MVNRIETVTGRDGNPTRALYSELKQRASGSTQDVLMLEPSREEGDMYISFWLKLQPDLLEKMTPQNWRAVFEWKTGGDYRLIVMRELGKRVSWRHGKAWQSRCRWSIAGRRSSWKISAVMGPMAMWPSSCEKYGVNASSWARSRRRKRCGERPLGDAANGPSPD